VPWPAGPLLQSLGLRQGHLLLDLLSCRRATVAGGPEFQDVNDELPYQEARGCFAGQRAFTHEELTARKCPGMFLPQPG
jgi:hypothetical protein